MSGDNAFGVNLADIYDNGVASLEATDITSVDFKPTSGTYTTDAGTFAYTSAALSARSAALSALQACSSPAAAFACLATYYAGQTETELNDLMDEYEEQQASYRECLDFSTHATSKKAEANQNGTCPATEEDGDFETYMIGIAGTSEWKSIDSDDTHEHSADEWQAMCDILNNQKEKESNELNSLSTEMELAIQDSSEAEEMAANAVKKLSDMLSTQAKAIGG